MRELVSPRRLLFPLLVLALASVVPMFSGDYTRYTSELVIAYAVSALGLNLALGLAGVYSFGHGGFMLLGAYGTALALAKFGLPFWLAPVLSLAVGALAGAVLGLPSFRLSGFALAIVTFAFAASIYQAVQAFDYLGGPTGLMIPHGILPKSGTSIHLMCLFWLLVSVVWSISIATSKTGRALRCIAGHEIVAVCLGINVNRYKILIFTVSAGLAAVSGSLLAIVSGIVAPDTYSPDLSIEIFGAVMIGGVGTLLGPVIGALFVVLVPEIIQAGTNLSAVIFAALFLVVATLLPNGLAGLSGLVATRRRVPVPRQQQQQVRP